MLAHVYCISIKEMNFHYTYLLVEEVLHEMNTGVSPSVSVALAEYHPLPVWSLPQSHHHRTGVFGAVAVHGDLAAARELTASRRIRGTVVINLREDDAGLLELQQNFLVRSGARRQIYRLDVEVDCVEHKRDEFPERISGNTLSHSLQDCWNSVCMQEALKGFYGK